MCCIQNQKFIYVCICLRDVHSNSAAAYRSNYMHHKLESVFSVFSCMVALAKVFAIRFQLHASAQPI